MSTELKLAIRIDHDYSEIDAAAWDALVGDNTPFMEMAWLRTLDETGCARPERGWMPQVLTAWLGERMVGALPLYIKGNSYGEFVYDWAWADLARRVGVEYYPKMIAAIPFSPVSGDRIMVSSTLDGPMRRGVLEALAATAVDLARDVGVSGVHFLFLPRWQAEILEDMGLFLRTSLQYHWRNADYDDFDDFLARFRSKKRAQIRRERREVAKRGLTVEDLDGHAIAEQGLTNDLYRFYTATTDKFVWGRQYLCEEVFERVVADMPDRVRMVLARTKDGSPVAGTFNMVKEGRFYGRYWGCYREIDFLHFEVCYYYPVEMAIRESLQHIEPGAGGGHKYVRGYEPVTTYSAHWLSDPQLDVMLRRYCAREREAVDHEVEEMLARSPLKPLSANE